MWWYDKKLAKTPSYVWILGQQPTLPGSLRTLILEFDTHFASEEQAPVEFSHVCITGTAFVLCLRPGKSTLLCLSSMRPHSTLSLQRISSQALSVKRYSLHTHKVMHEYLPQVHWRLIIKAIHLKASKVFVLFNFLVSFNRHGFIISCCYMSFHFCFISSQPCREQFAVLTLHS